LYQAQELIVDEYKSKGYYFASATLDKPLLEKSLIARYTIAEGPKVIIRKVTFSGNDSLSSGNIKDQIETKERFWPFISGAYSEQTLDDDVEKIKAYYVAQGFLDVQARRKVEFSDNQEKAFVEFVLKEGQRYHVASVAIRGAKTLSSAYLAERFKLQPGAAYVAEALKADKKFIIDSYGKIGFVHAIADPKIEYTTEPGKVDLVFDIVEGPKVNIGEITITGNKVTQDKVILRALSFEPEQVANATAIKNAQDRLMQTQLFNSVDISLIPTADPAVENILVNLEEKDTASLMFGAGVSSNSGLIGNVSLTQKNFDWARWPKGPNDSGAFRGAGQTVRLSLSPGTETQEYSLGFTEPSFFDRDVRFDTSASYFKRKRESYDEGRLGAQASVGKSLWKDIYGSVGLRVEQIDISNLAWDAPQDVRDVQGHSYLSTVNAKLERDKTDNYFVPTTGDRESVTVEQAGVLGGDYTFTKFLVDGKRYWTVTEDLEGRRSFFSLKSRVGFTPSDTPIFERFYAGGQGSIRGFKYRGVGPRADDSNSTPLGGDFMLLTSGEYEYPIYGKNVSGVFFLDSGTVEQNIGMSSYRIAAGFGFRFTIPLLGAPIPFALDFGFPLAKADQDETQIFSFSMAFNF
jgi:outer membrane protein assembly complex protein YaeT